MIHFIKEGGGVHLGLNLYRAPGGFVAIWVWYDMPEREIVSRRLRIRLHKRPVMLYSKDRYNVVHGYLWERNGVVVNRDVMKSMCEDLGIIYAEETYTEGWR